MRGNGINSCMHFLDCILLLNRTCSFFFCFFFSFILISMSILYTISLFFACTMYTRTATATYTWQFHFSKEWKKKNRVKRERECENRNNFVCSYAYDTRAYKKQQVKTSKISNIHTTYTRTHII